MKTLVVAANAREAEEYIRQQEGTRETHEYVSSSRKLEGIGPDHFRVVLMERAFLRSDYQEIAHVLERAMNRGVEVGGE